MSYGSYRAGITYALKELLASHDTTAKVHQPCVPIDLTFVSTFSLHRLVVLHCLLPTQVTEFIRRLDQQR